MFKSLVRVRLVDQTVFATVDFRVLAQFFNPFASNLKVSV